jgi:hypothetical protein
VQAGSAGTAGSAGNGGTAGTAGTAGTSGSAGEGGSGGDGGSAGEGGSGGAGGSPGEGGSSGDITGSGGAGGDPSIAGAGGVGGSGEPVGTITNLALGKTATADSEENGNFAPRGVDGDDATRWCAANGDDGHWVKVDLGAAHELTGAEIFWEASATYMYKIEVSNDDQTWMQVVDQTANATQAQTTTDAFTANARYVRVTTTNIDPNWRWASFWEFRVMGY